MERAVANLTCYQQQETENSTHKKNPGYLKGTGTVLEYRVPFTHKKAVLCLFINDTKLECGSMKVFFLNK